MRAVCFYNNLESRTAAALERWAPGHERVDTSASLQTYAAELAARWNSGDDLVLIEQDKEIHGGVLPSFAECGEPWCGFTYWIDPAPHTTLVLGGFGVTKFSAAIQAKVAVADFAWREWRGIDRRFNDLLLSMGIGCCLHGHVNHHHAYPPRPQAVVSHVASLRAQGLIAPSPAPPAPGPGRLPGSPVLTRVLT